jgi:mitofilin
VSAKEDAKATKASQGKGNEQAKGTVEPKEAAPTTQAKTPLAKAEPKQEVKKDAGPGTTETAAPTVKPPVEEAKPATPQIEPIDHLNVPEAGEEAVQKLVAFINRLITVTNASPEMARYRKLLAREDVQQVIDSVASVKERASHDAEDKVQKAHGEFDTAAKELVGRLEREMQDQELKWREEYESEREKLSENYQQKLALELDAAQKVADQKTQNSLLEQEIALQKKFMDSVRASVESEREGRLAKLDELSSSVSELENLTSQWNDVVDANLQTQHLHVALEAVRARVTDAEHPSPFVNELVALKEVSASDDLVSAAIASIPPQAYNYGIPTVSQLIDRFRRVATEVRKASLLPEDAGVASHAASAVLSRLMFSKKADRGLPEGEDVEATLARTETLLEEGDLDAAAREMNALKGWAGVLGRDWVSECRRVLEVRQAVDVSLPFLLFCSLSCHSDGGAD